MTDFKDQQCQACEGGVDPLEQNKIDRYLTQVNPRWSHYQTDTSAIDRISASFKFKDHYETAGFVNAVIWINHQQDHHPQIEFGYNSVTIDFHTHAINGLSENDFICAAKIDALLD